jgi:poly-gamma-glutamate capsule biosynthesis protein CapA/YwtB (metallophosphatase superfamily)
VTVRLFGVGDVFPNVEDGRAAFRHLSPLLRKADLVVGNCEGVYSDRAYPVPSHKHPMIAPRARGEGLGEAPFHLLSCANNHAMDGGFQGLADTIELLASQGIAVTGAGQDLARATAATIFTRGGLRIAFVGFCSVFPVGYEARAARPGIAAIRVRTHYCDPDRNFWEPGIPPAIFTEPMEDDLQTCAQALERARAAADVVVALCHWGYSSWLEVLQDYETRLARYIVDHGADIVLCCHQHSLRGVEFRDRRPIFYGLGSLVHHIRMPAMTPEEAARRRARGAGNAPARSAEYPLFPFHPDARMTGIATFDVAADGSLTTGFIPAMILPDGSTEPLSPDDPRAGAVADYLERITRERGFTTKFSRGQWEGVTRIEIAAGEENTAGRGGR